MKTAKKNVCASIVLCVNYVQMMSALATKLPVGRTSVSYEREKDMPVFDHAFITAESLTVRSVNPYGSSECRYQREVILLHHFLR